MLTGQVWIRSRSPERILSLCGELGLTFRDLRWDPDGGVRFRLSRRDHAVLTEETGELEVVGESGLPVLYDRLRRRPALALSLTVGAFALFLGSFFVWGFEVTGNETVPTETILRALETCGVGPGTFALSLDGADLRDHVLLEVPELVWIAVNVSGCKAHVQVRERVPPPERMDGGAPSDVTARRAGLVIEVLALDGRAAVLPGTTVEAGDLLISGVEALGREDLAGGGIRAMPGRGSVRARTWHTLTATVPLSGTEGRYTGEERTARYLLLGRRRIGLPSSLLLPRQEDGTGYGKTTVRSRWSLLGIPLPLGTVRETYRAYEAVPVSRSAAEAASRTEEALREQLLAEVAPYGEVRSVLCTSRRRGDALDVTLAAECLEEIGVTVPILPYGEDPARAIS